MSIIILSDVNLKSFHLYTAGLLVLACSQSVNTGPLSQGRFRLFFVCLFFPLSVISLKIFFAMFLCTASRFSKIT